MGAGAPSAAAGSPGAPAAAPGGGTSGGGNEDSEWVDNRYLDDKGEPLKGTNHPYAEFKQMFVYMKFIMDQRRIPELVAACANANLPIETRQIKVQMLKSESGSSSGGSLFGGATFGGGGGMGPGAMGAGGGMGPSAGAGGGMGPVSGGRGMGGGMQPNMGGAGGAMGGPDMGGGMGAPNLVLDGGVETTIYDAVVELSGVIYLYRPPDIAKLGSGSAGSPDKRSFGVPTTTVPAPGAVGGGGVKTMMGSAGPPAR
jgi:hypothetical protein